MVRDTLETRGITAGSFALADDAQRAMSPVEAQILGVGGAGLAHPQSVEAEKGRQCGMVRVVALGREEESAELPRSSPRTSLG